MMRFVALVAALTISLSSSPLLAQGQPVKSLDQAKQLCESVLKAASARDYLESQNKLRPYTPQSDEEFKAYAERVSGQLKSLEDRLGPPMGYGFIETVEVGDFIRSFHYALKYQNGIVRWNFVFYRPEGEWLFHYTELQAIAPIKI
jgi:hypothetical protein